MITCKLIKEGVETLSGITDLTVRDRTMYVINARMTYYKLCKMFTDKSLEKIGKIMGNRTHATVLSGIKTFDNLYATGELLTEDIYRVLTLSYSKGEKALDIRDIKSVEGVKKYYRIKFLRHIEKSHKLINKYRRKLNKIERHTFISKVLELDEIELKELEYKFDVFFKVKKHLKQKTKI
jgi:hypothetical protein